LSKGAFNQTAWHMAAREGHVEVLDKLWDLAKELQLKPEKLRNEMLVSKNNFDQTAWHIVAGEIDIDILEKLWD
jgi:ankyrin repeat protein